MQIVILLLQLCRCWVNRIKNVPAHNIICTWICQVWLLTVDSCFPKVCVALSITCWCFTNCTSCLVTEQFTTLKLQILGQTRLYPLHRIFTLCCIILDVSNDCQRVVLVRCFHLVTQLKFGSVPWLLQHFTTMTLPMTCVDDCLVETESILSECEYSSIST